MLKKIFKKSINSLGIEVRRHYKRPPLPEPVDSVDLCRSRINAGEKSVFLCPLDQCVTFHGFSLKPQGWHPFVQACRQYLSEDEITPYSDSVLREYYQRWHPANAREALIGMEDGPQVLADYPAYTMHNPWIESSPEERRRFMTRVIREENSNSGLESVGPEEGYGLHGPVSERKGQLEYQRLISALRSIRQYGYLRSPAHEDITVIAIKDGEDQRFCIAHGQHRAAVLAALGYTHVPAAPIKLLNIKELPHWHQVYRGNWQLNEARHYVNHLFTFDSLAWAEEKGLPVYKPERYVLGKE